MPTTTETRAATSAGYERAGHAGILFALGLLLIAYIACYASVMTILVRQWRSIETYSFGMLVPAISAYLIWLRAPRLRQLPIAPAYVSGGVAVVCAAALLLLGRSSALVGLQELSLVLMIPALVLLALGRGFLRALWFPLAYLLLMLPVWDVFTEPIHYPFQLISARVGLHLLRLMGIAARLDHTYLFLPNVTLEVAKACSGVNYLISIVAMGVPLAYVALRGWLTRGILVVSAVAIAIVSNGLRVALIGAFSYHGIGGYLHGPGHIFTGLFVSAVGFAALLAGVALLAVRDGKRPNRLTENASTAPSSSFSDTHVTSRRAVFAASLVLFAVAGSQFAAHAVTVTPEPDYVPPLRPGWRALPDAAAAPFVAVNPGEESPRSRVVVAPTGERIEFVVTSFAVTEADGALVYRAVELPAQPETVTVALATRDVRVNQVAFRSSGRETLVAFWYDLGGRITTNVAVAKGYTAVQRLVGFWPAARLVLVASDARPDDAAFATFLKDILASIAR